jgi:hypothetical protein
MFGSSDTVKVEQERTEKQRRLRLTEAIFISLRNGIGCVQLPSPSFLWIDQVSKQMNMKDYEID